MDNITKIYKEQVLIEMTNKLSQFSGTILTDKDISHYRNFKNHFNLTKTERGFDLGNFDHPGNRLYVTFDGGNPIHASHIKIIDKNRGGLNFRYGVQSSVNRILDNKYSGIPREAMHHFINTTGYPLVTDSGQTPSGHSMWRKFAKESLELGNHVYMWDGNLLHKSDKTSIDDHLNEYYGKDKHMHRMVVSKKELNA